MRKTDTFRMSNGTKSLLVASLGIIFFAVVGCRAHEEYLEGRDQAEIDLAKGILKVAIEDGTNMPAFGEYTVLLRDRYRIGWISYSLPSNREAAAEWVRGYNEVALPRIKTDFGAQVLEKTMADAQKLHGTMTTKH